MKRVAELLKAHYDKLMAVVVLLCLLASALYLAIMVGNIQSMQEQFDREIRSVTPEFPEALSTATGVYETNLASLREPVQVSAWSNAMLAAEDRVRCVDAYCARPIRFLATVCPFCGEEQPPEEVDTPEYDGDKDGMWDSWERDNSLDPSDPDDAARDADGDQFSNLEEFGSDPRTNPKDATDYPPLEAKIRVTKILADPFKLKFKGVQKLPNGLKFQLNLRGDSKTFFAKMDEEVEGFKLVEYTPKMEEQEIEGIGKRQVNVSILVLERAGKRIELQYGKEVQYSELTAELLFSLDNTKYPVSVGTEFSLKDKKYKVEKIDRDKRSVVIERIHDGKKFMIRKVQDHGSEE